MEMYEEFQFGAWRECKKSATLRSSGGLYGGGTESIVADKMYAVRRLTPRECERLQGLPDDYTYLPDEKSCSDSARYKALGNGMSQPCADFVVRRIVEEVEKEAKHEIQSGIHH